LNKKINKRPNSGGHNSVHGLVRPAWPNGQNSPMEQAGRRMAPAQLTVTTLGTGAVRGCQSQGRRNGGGEDQWGKASPSGKVVGSGTHQKGGGSTVRRQWQHREVVFRHWRGFRSSVAADARSYIIGERKSKLGARQIGPKVHGEVAH
jgi:hypothetical protein